MTDGPKNKDELRRLEGEVNSLRQQVRRLERERKHLLAGSDAPPASLPEITEAGQFTAGADGANPALETRVGVEWLTRTAAFLLLTAATIGAVRTLYSPDLTSLNKLGILYTVSLVALMYGVVGRRTDGLLPKVALGGGLAGAYFATYALFFVDAVAVIPNRQWALPALLAALAFMGWILAWRRSQTAASIALFLVYYTMIASAAEATDTQRLYYAFGAGAICSAMALWFMAAHRWYLVSWLSFFAVYGTHLYFFWPRITANAEQNLVLFWSSVGFLTLCYTLLAAGGTIEARAGMVTARSTVALALANTLTYSILTTRALASVHEPRLWLFPAGLMIVLFGLAWFAETSGPSTNLLYQVYLAMAVVCAAAAIAMFFDGGAVWMAFAALCLGLAVVHNATGIVIIKLLNICLLAIAGVGAMGAHRYTRHYTLPNDWGVVSEGWLCLAVVASLFSVTAWYYHAVVEARPAAERRRSGHWFLADTSYNLPATSVAMIHGVGAACVLCFGVIMLTDDRAMLPLVLTMGSVLLAAAGAFTNVPQVAAAAIGPLIAAQVTWYFNAVWSAEGPVDGRLSVGIAAFIATYGIAACLLWERYIKQDRRGPHWEYAVVAGVPFALCGIFIVSAVAHFMVPDAAPFVAVGIATAAAIASTAVQPSMMRIVGPSMVAMIAALQLAAYRSGVPSSETAMQAMYQAIALVAAALIIERILALRKLAGAIDVSRLVMLGTAGVIGLAVLERYAPPELRIAGWIAMTVAALLTGVILPEAYYRLLALGLIAATSVRAFTGTGPWQARTFALLGTIVLAVSWYYSHEIAQRNERRKQ